jgi:hypothetical protein
MSKFITVGALFGEKFAINVDKITTVANVSDKSRVKLLEVKGPEWATINTILHVADEGVYSTDTFDEVVSKINAA